MDLNNKLKNIPKLYYLNLDERPDRRLHIEKQFEEYKITNYTRFSTSKFLASKFDEWKHLIHHTDREIYQTSFHQRMELGSSLSYLDFIRTWLTTTDEKFLFVMEDDQDLSYIDYWHFDWDYLMNNIPYDWDCIQLGFENFWEIPCFLHPIHPYHATGPSLFTRRYLEKLISIHLIDGKYNLHQKINNFKWSVEKDWTFRVPPRWIEDPDDNIIIQGVARPTPCTGDYFLGHCGRTYCLPLISLNPNIGSREDDFHRNDRGDLLFTRRAYDIWWKVLRDSYTLRDFFTYGKPNDLYINHYNIYGYELKL